MITNKQLDTIFNGIALLSRHEYWSKELWRQRVEGFENADKADVQNAFIIARLHHSCATFLAPVGCCWAREVSDEHSVDYIKIFQPIFDDYWHWQLEQR